MAVLIAPQPCRHLRRSFLRAQDEHDRVDGGPDADGLTMAMLEEHFEDYALGLAGTRLMPWGAIAARLPTFVLGWVENGPDGPEYLGRGAFRRHLIGDGVTIVSTLRPSARDGGDAELLASACAIARGRGLDPGPRRERRP